MNLNYREIYVCKCFNTGHSFIAETEDEANLFLTHYGEWGAYVYFPYNAEWNIQ